MPAFAGEGAADDEGVDFVSAFVASRSTWTASPPRSITVGTKSASPPPVKVGSRIRMRATIAEVTEVKGGAQIKVSNTIEIYGQ